MVSIEADIPSNRAIVWPDRRNGCNSFSRMPRSVAKFGSWLPQSGLIALHIGLDARKYQIAASAPQAEQEMHPLESTLSDEERFKDAQTLSLVCLGCNETFHFEGLNQSLSMCTNDGIKCQTPKCSRVLPNSALITQVETNIRNYTASYYESWLRCDDPSCSTRTRQICVYGKRCLGPQGLASGCLGITSYEKSDKMLYNQLLYLSSLFDVDKAKSKATGPDRGKKDHPPHSY